MATTNPTPPTHNPVLIIGAGISGLTLAQACRKYAIHYRLFERDSSSTSRSAGWGLTLNWALETFRSLLPQDVLELLGETLVNKAAVDAGEKGSFTFFDLRTGEAKWKVPASERLRISRHRLKWLLLSGVEVEWGMQLTDIQPADYGTTAVFADGTSVTGALIIGCDGARSRVRQLAHPDEYENKQLPVRFIGAGVVYPEDKIAEMRKLDPYFLQGSHPKTDVFLWFSFLDTPADPSSIGEHDAAGQGEVREGQYRCQIMTSWPYRPGFLNHPVPMPCPPTAKEQLAFMKRLASEFCEPFRSVVEGIGEDAEVKEVHLADWMPRPTSTTALGKSLKGRVCLVGDAAHAMVMYRGEGANHAIVDVGRLVELLRPLYEGSEVDDGAWAKATAAYEAEMVERSAIGVLASRQACLDAHEWGRLNDGSPLVRRRLMRADLEETAG